MFGLTLFLFHHLHQILLYIDLLPQFLYFLPILLKEYNNRWFLIGYAHKKHDVVNLALDRIVSVAKDERHPFVENSFFDPDTFLGEMIGVTRNISSQPERVTIRLVGHHAPYVLTKPLHDSQQMIHKEPNGDVVIALDVIVNHELENKILALGPFAEVLTPAHLRATIAEQLALAASYYAGR